MKKMPVSCAALSGAKKVKEETVSYPLFIANPKTNLTYEKNSNYVITIFVP